MTDQTIENPEPSAKGRILSGLKSSSGQMEGLKKFVEKHLETPTAQEEVLTDLVSIEDMLDESAELLIADTKN